MFSQWRSKRHFPMDAAPSVIPKSSSQPTSPVDSDFSRADNSRSVSHQSSFQGRPTGVKAFSKAVIGKGGRLRTATREGSAGTPSPLSFAAGPRNSNRGSNILEFGGGVVPDDSFSDAELSDSSLSPVTPHHFASTNQRNNDVGSTASVLANVAATPPSPTRASSAQHGQAADHVRLKSIGSIGSFEDFRSLIAFSSPSHLPDESPALTTSTTLSTPDFAAAVSVTANKPLPVSIADKPQPPLPASSFTTAKPHILSSPDKASATQSLRAMQTPPKRIASKTGSSSIDEPVAVFESSFAGPRRGSNAPSVPESVSEFGSSQHASDENPVPSHSRSANDAVRRLEQSSRRGSEGAVTFGLGISSTSDQGQTASASNNRTGHPIPRSSFSTRRHTKTSSEMSENSSSDSWARTSFGRDSLRILSGSDPLDEAHKLASSSSIRTNRTYISDSGHSTNTAETSTDVHDSDQLSTIKETTESPQSLLHRQTSPGSSTSRSRMVGPSDADLHGPGGFRSGPVELHSSREQDRLPSLAEAREIGADAHSSTRDPSLQSAAGDLGPSALGSRARKVSHSSIVGLLPPLDLDVPSQRSHNRRSSNASWTQSRKAPSELLHITGPRRGSADTVSSTAQPRLVSETYTAPLPSKPFPLSTSTSTPMLQASFALSTGQTSVPNTPNLAYEAALSKAVGKQRKNRPAALALNLAALSAFAPNGGVASPNLAAFKGLASPGRLRAPPPSAPPAEPLPPIPNTPSLAPKSPSVRQCAGSCASPVRNTNAAGADASDTLATPTQTHSSSFSRGIEAQDCPSSMAPSSAATLISAVASGTQPRFSAETARQAKHATPVKTDGHDTVQRSVTVPSAAEKTPNSSPALVPVDESPDGAATVTVAQTVTRASLQPVRLSISKKGNDALETTKTAVSTVVATEHADGQIVSPVIKPRELKGASEAAVANADAEKPGSSAITPSQTTSSDGTLPPKQTNRTSQLGHHRRATADKPARPPPSAWNGRAIASVSHGDVTIRNSSDIGDDDSNCGAASVASCHSTISTISDRRLEILQDKEALLSAISEPARKEILKRTEGRFAGAFGEVATAFRQLQADKRLLEQIVREKTPLSGVGTNNEMLSGYLSTMNTKLESSHAEIRKLLDLLEQQREVMEQMMATHQLQRETYEEEVGELHRALDEVHEEADYHRAQVVKLNEELAKAHTSMVQANAEAMRARTTLTEESRKREKVVSLLRRAKDKLREVEAEDVASQQQEQQSDSKASEALDGEHSASTLFSDHHHHPATSALSPGSEILHLRRMLLERDAEISSLRLSHADSLLQQHQHQQHDDTHSLNHHSSASTSEHGSSSEEITRLRAQVSEQREREKHIRSAYLYVREELRKVNVERRRSSSISTSASHLTTDGSTMARARQPATPVKYHAPMIGGGGAGAALEGDVASGEEGKVKLKRLSLPIVARASGIVVAVGSGSDAGHQQQEQQQQRGKMGSPPSAFRYA